MVEFNKKKLENGLTILHEKRDVPVTSVVLAAKYGSAYETEEEKGIAHFIEHLCFKGTEKRNAREIAASLEKVGGNLNAFTADELTAYHVRLPSKHLGLAMDVIFDVFFNPVFPEEDVAREAGVICEEIKMYYDNPHARVLEKIKSNLYDKPFGLFAAGREEVIKSMTREQLLERHRKIYIPENAVLCVVGNNDFEDVLKFAESFCVDRKGEKKEIPEIKKMIKKEKEERGLQQVNLALGFHFPYDEKGRYVAEIFSTILGRGMSSRLFIEVREKRGLVYAVKSEADIGSKYGYMIIFAGTEKQKTEEVIDICLKEFEKMKDLSEEELEEGKVQIIGHHEVETEGSNETAVNLILEELQGDAEDYYNFDENIKNVSLEDVRKLAENSEYSSFVLE